MSRKKNKLLARSLVILKDMYSEGTCRYDFYGNCLTHNWMNKENHCPHVRARSLFEEIKLGADSSKDILYDPNS